MDNEIMGNGGREVLLNAQYAWTRRTDSAHGVTASGVYDFSVSN